MVLENFAPLIESDFVQLVLHNEFAVFGLILTTFLVIGAVSHLFLGKFLRKLTKKTETDIDDKIFGIIAGPIFLMINLFGLYLAINSLSFLESYTTIIEDVFFVVYIVVAGFVGGKFVELFVGRMIAHRTGVSKTPGLLMRILNIIIYLIALLVILHHFSIDVTAAVAALGLGGIAIGLALQGTLTNFFSGVHIVTDRPINVGDYVEIKSEGIEGFVVDIGWRSTRIRTLPNSIVIVPNTKLAESVIINDDLQDREMGFIIKCGVSYESDLAKVENVTLDVARKIQQTVPGAVKDFEPLIRFNNFGDSNIEFNVILRVTEFVNKFVVTHEFIKALKDRYDKEGIEISWPVRKIYYGDGKHEHGH